MAPRSAAFDLAVASVSLAGAKKFFMPAITPLLVAGLGGFSGDVAGGDPNGRPKARGASQLLPPDPGSNAGAGNVEPPPCPPALVVFRGASQLLPPDPGSNGGSVDTPEF